MTLTRKNRAIRTASTITLAIALAGCTQVLVATNDGPITQDPGQRTMGTAMDDHQIMRHFTVNLAKTLPVFKESNVNVLSYNGIVLLTGELPNRQLKKIAGDTARALNSVRQVHNQIAIAGQATVYSQANDKWIGTKIRTKLIASDKIESNRVKIVVENRTVYVMGLLSPSEAEHVTQLASETEGVVQVVRAIELINEHSRAPH